MTKGDKFYCAAICIATLLIGLFFGATLQQTKEAILQEEVENLTYKLRAEMYDTDYWKTRFEDQDTVLHKISDHKDCTFELRKIIGDLE